VRFFCGIHHPSDAIRVPAAFVSVNAIRNRKSAFSVLGDWIMDSGAFTTIAKHGGYPEPVEAYAEQVRRWKSNGNMLAAISQDYMCEPMMLEKTGKSIPHHQWLTIWRYDQLLACKTGAYIMPVLQGYAPSNYAQHVKDYGDRLADGQWVGVGSVCKRNSDPGKIVEVLSAIKKVRPDLRLHGFGLKLTALQSGLIRQLLDSADSMAWSFAARMQGRNPNDWREAVSFVHRIENASYQHDMGFLC